VPLTFIEVLFNSEGAVAVMVTAPGAIQVALPSLSMVAIVELDVVQVSPSASVSSPLD
jgi:hypothetical protein